MLAPADRAAGAEDEAEDGSPARFGGLRSPRGFPQAPAASTDYSEAEHFVSLADAALAALRLDCHARKDIDIVTIGDWLLQVKTAVCADCFCGVDPVESWSILGERVVFDATFIQQHTFVFAEQPFTWSHLYALACELDGI